MKNQIKPMLQNAASQIQEGSDFLLLVHRDGKYGAIARATPTLSLKCFSHCFTTPRVRWLRPFIVS